MHVACLRDKMSIHLAWKVKIALFLAIKVTILNEYLGFADIFLKESAIKLPKRFDINKDVINLKPGK